MLQIAELKSDRVYILYVCVHFALLPRYDIPGRCTCLTNVGGVLKRTLRCRMYTFSAGWVEWGLRLLKIPSAESLALARCNNAVLTEYPVSLL